MSSVFRRGSDEKIKFPRYLRNLSHTNNLTAAIGKEIPVLCQEVLPGDSFKIRPDMAIYTFPTAFAIQTPIKATIDFFYVRNRALWNGWKDFISGNPMRGRVMPYFEGNEEQRKRMFGESKLMDYLGAATTFYGKTNNTLGYCAIRTAYQQQDATCDGQSCLLYTTYGVEGGDTRLLLKQRGQFGNSGLMSLIYPIYHSLKPGLPEGDEYMCQPYTPAYTNYLDNLRSKGLYAHNLVMAYVPSNKPMVLSYNGALDNSDYPTPFEALNNFCYSPISINYANATFQKWRIKRYDESTCNVPTRPTPSNLIRLMFYDDDRNLICTCRSDHPDTLTDWEFSQKYSDLKSLQDVNVSIIAGLSNGIRYHESEDAYDFFSSNVPEGPFNFKDYHDYLAFGYGTDIHDLSTEDGKSYFPYTPDKLKLNTLAPRAYELIHNAWYRDSKNNPYRIDGEAVYNEFLPTTDGGLDSHVYELHRANWQDDVFTTALHNPIGVQPNGSSAQPIVGLTSVDAEGVFTFGDGDHTYKAKTYAKDGDHVDSFTIDPNSPKAIKESMSTALQQGITISDFRNVNAFTKWLEIRNRKGSMYKDFMEGMYGTSLGFNELLLPEYIGGISRNVNTNPVFNTAAGPNNATLGEVGGNLSVVGSGQTMTKYCDEHGFIIGILRITPAASYSQLLPKHFLKGDTPLDYFNPMFGNISYQPISLKELCPLQITPEHYNDTFGYNLPWYEYLANVDGVHGKFKSELRNFLITRVFDSVPELGEDFLTINEDDCNNVFVTKYDGDKFLGQIRFEMYAKREVPDHMLAKLD